MNDQHEQSRRRFLQMLAAIGAGGMLPPLFAGQAGKLVTKPIPSSKEKIPVIGLGSSRTFNVGSDQQARDACAEVMRNFFSAGGTMIDSSPMYGTSPDVIGYGLNKIGKLDAVFSADKVWTWSVAGGPAQIERSRKRWQVKKFDLMQVHNLVKWEQHLPMLQEMKKQGKLRYVGITTSHGRRHDDFEKVMRTQTLDFVQLSYNIVDREVEQRLLPLAKERGIAVIVNRPFQRGDLIDRVKKHPLPAWAKDIDCKNWAEFLLKFIVSHPAVSCAIPATTSVDHVLENMGAATGTLPDASYRKKMIAYVEKL